MGWNVRNGGFGEAIEVSGYVSLSCFMAEIIKRSPSRQPGARIDMKSSNLPNRHISLICSAVNCKSS